MARLQYLIPGVLIGVSLLIALICRLFKGSRSDRYLQALNRENRADIERTAGMRAGTTREAPSADVDVAPPPYAQQDPHRHRPDDRYEHDGDRDRRRDRAAREGAGVRAARLYYEQRLLNEPRPTHAHGR